MPSGNAHPSRVLRLACAAGVTVATAALIWYSYRARCAAAARSRRRSSTEDATLSQDLLQSIAREASEFGCAVDEGLQQEFAWAAAWVSSEASAGLATTAKLALYGAYKQAVAGDAPAERPRGMEAGAKWDAWKPHSGARCSEAMRRYLSVLDMLAPQWRSGGVAEDSEESRQELGGALGLAVSTMGRINVGGASTEDDVDETPVGQLCEKIAEGEVDGAQDELRRHPGLAFQADKDGMTPLHWAADRGQIGIASVLVGLAGTGPAAAALLNVQDENGDTALHYAVMSEHRELAQLLASSGADAHAKNADGETPSGLAAELDGWEDVFRAA